MKGHHTLLRFALSGCLVLAGCCIHCSENSRKIRVRCCLVHPQAEREGRCVVHGHPAVCVCVCLFFCLHQVLAVTCCLPYITHTRIPYNNAYIRIMPSSWQIEFYRTRILSDSTLSKVERSSSPFSTRATAARKTRLGSWRGTCRRTAPSRPESRRSSSCVRRPCRSRLSRSF